MINKILDVDKAVFLYLNNLGTSFWDPFWILVSNKLCMFFFLVIVMIASTKKLKIHKRDLFNSILFMILCISLTDLIHVHMFKNTFMRFRPCWDPEIAPFTRIIEGRGGYYSFVSGHAANSSVIVTFFILCYKNIHIIFKYILIIWLFLVCYSRIYLGKHYMLDVICGLLLGVVIGLSMFRLYHFFTKKNITK